MALAIIAVAITAPPSASATTRNVSQGQSIQAAINASANGDTVKVSPGTYYGNLTLNGRYISLIGDIANPSSTIIRANSTSAAAVFISNVPWASDRKTIVSGFTIADGNAPSGQGGGITVFNDANPEITHNIITNNTAHGYGGGIEIFTNATPIIANNTIFSNQATSGGGGIFVYNGSSPVIYNNLITSNSTSGASIANGGSSGGGIYLENTGDPNAHSNPVVLNNEISGNTAEFAGGGIMVRTGANVIIEGNHVANNKAGYGAGIHLESTGSNATLTSNVIEGNSAATNPNIPGSGVGGGVAIFDSTVATLTSNTIRDNSASNIGGGISSGENASTTLTGNLIAGNFVSGGDNSKQGGGLYAANSMLTATNNQFVANSATIGGGISLTNVPATLVNNTLVNNHATGAAGGAIYVASGSVALVNNLLTQNDGYQVFFQLNVGPTRLDNNLITTPNSTPAAEGSGLYFDYAHRYTTSAQLNSVPNAHNNVVVDPGFVNYGGGDFSLSSNSGAIDVGTNISIPPVANDYRRAIRQTSSIDIGAFEYVASPVIPAHVYRFWSESKKSHFFTISNDERNLVASTYNPAEWRYEGMAFDAFTSSLSGTVPLYRFYSASYQSHFYTANAAEADGLRSDAAMKLLWSYEGVAYYVYPLDTGVQSRPVFRFWSPDNKTHFYTASAAESAEIQSLFPLHVWSYEGPNFRVPQ
ncbi:right-handed parallel beta-helix repeat-containing protein [Frigoribacterium sp. CG_9.8]|uniref:right-handed parallel beta-helix repeat-containing protein n=1 Tax=Frigoribacterium sp. CG_9.8 TaxID=2787733 RepID=UPI0018CB64EE|nr:right-handed parallel beta-helix repeat-containing protein [Frigoribacterium sp. CG_9.8]MBG6106764.1 parallel beta-helix repeat protein [Frigoribacterium sp. CG_9.8]